MPSTLLATPPAQLILASQSSYRKTQLKQLGVPFDTHPAHIDETLAPEESAADAAIRLAEQKALCVANQHPHAHVIGCDQTAQFENTILGKPGTVERAVSQLLACQGKTVVFYSALCLLAPRQAPDLQSSHSGANPVHKYIDCTQTRVTFRKLTETQIRSYIQRESPLDCAGSFKCEGLGISLFESIHSDDPSALVGLPLIALCSALQNTPFQPI